LYTPPVVQLTISFEFTARLRVGFVLDTKGIREAVEQKAIEKALNSFALRDTFDGVDEAMVTLTASVTLAVEVSAAIVKIGVSGGITFVVTIDLYDPYPDTSNGLVRPFELLSSGSSPLEWFEFGVQIYITISIYIQIGLFLGFFEIVLFEYRKEFKFNLIDPIIFTPALEAMPVNYDSASGVLVLAPGSEELQCTSLSGTLGNEEIECVKGLGIISFSGVRSIGAHSTASVASESGASLLLRNVQSQVDFSTQSFNTLTLDYVSSGASIIANGNIYLDATQVRAGSAVASFQSVDTGIILLPQPEQAGLTTTIEDCDSLWVLTGHTNIEIYAWRIKSGCAITAEASMQESDPGLNDDVINQNKGSIKQGTSRTTDFEDFKSNLKTVQDDKGLFLKKCMGLG